MKLPNERLARPHLPKWARAVTAGVVATALGIGPVLGSGVLDPAGAGTARAARTDTAATDGVSSAEPAGDVGGGTDTSGTELGPAPPDTDVDAAVDGAGAAGCASWPDLGAAVAAAASVDPSGIGVWVIDLADGCSFGFNGSTEFSAASTIKLLALAGLLEDAQE